MPSLWLSAPLLPIALAYAAGVLAHPLLPLPPWGLGLAALALAGISFWSWRRLVTITPLLLALFFLLGALGMAVNQPPPSLLLRHTRTFLDLTGVVTEEPRLYPNRSVYVLAAQRIKQGEWRLDVGEKVELRIYGQGPKLSYGDVVVVHGQLKAPSPARNPGEFNYAKYLSRRGIFTTLAVGEPGAIKVVGKAPTNPWIGLALAAKARVAKAITAAVPASSAGMLQGVLFGDEEMLGTSQIDTYKNLGLYHVFAVSGLHLGFVLLFLTILCQLAGLGRIPTAALTAAGILFYAAVAGFTPSVSRATVMALVGLGGRAFNRQAYSYNSLALAALVLLLANPWELFEPGFQLSFAAAWGIIFLSRAIGDGADHMAERLAGPRLGMAGRKVIGWASSALAVPLGAQLAVLPLVAFYFNLASPWGILANLALVWLVGIAVILGLAGFILAVIWSPLAAPPLVGAGAILELVDRVATWIRGLPAASLPVASPAPVAIALYYLVLVLMVWLGLNRGETWLQVRWLRYRRQLALGAGGATSVVLIIFTILPLWRPPELKVTFLDVGQGSSVFISTPAGKKLLIDGGGLPWRPSLGKENRGLPGVDNGFDVGEKIVVPFLVRQGVRNLDWVISTHPDADHLQGLEAVVEHLPASRLAVPGALVSAREYAGLFAACASRGTEICPLTGGQCLYAEPGLTVTALHPQAAGSRTGDGSAGPGAIAGFSSTGASPGALAGPSGAKKGSNNFSLVLQLTYGRFRLLLPGDLEKEGMEELLGRLGNQAPQTLASNILLYPHHGSAGGLDPKFLEAVNPQAVIIQVGEDNSFGHPAPAVLNYWAQRWVPVYRTDRQGAITVIARPDRLLIQPFLSAGGP